jgi:hypothetical protein
MGRGEGLLSTLLGPWAGIEQWLKWGHQDAFLRSRLSVCYGFSQGTFAGTRCNGRDAPKNEPARAGGGQLTVGTFLLG